MVGLRDADDRVLLVRTSRLPDWWQPIGGGIEPEDDGRIEALVREVEEEVHVKMEERDFRPVLNTPYDFGEGTVHFFEARIGNLAAQLSFSPREIVEYRWFRLDETDGLPMFPATHAFLKTLSGLDDARR